MGYVNAALCPSNPLLPLKKHPRLTEPLTEFSTMDVNISSFVSYMWCGSWSTSGAQKLVTQQFLEGFLFAMMKQSYCSLFGNASYNHLKFKLIHFFCKLKVEKSIQYCTIDKIKKNYFKIWTAWIHLLGESTKQTVSFILESRLKGGNNSRVSEQAINQTYLFHGQQEIIDCYTAGTKKQFRDLDPSSGGLQVSTSFCQQVQQQSGAVHICQYHTMYT